MSVIVIPMTNEFSGHIAHRLCRIAALEHENHKNNYALRVPPCSAKNSVHSLHPKTHPSWVYKIRVAMLSSPENDQTSLFFETVARNRGIDLMVFQAMHYARERLLGHMTTNTTDSDHN